MPQVKISTTVVRMAVARLELTPDTPIFAKIAVIPAKKADNKAQTNQFIHLIVQLIVARDKPYVPPASQDVSGQDDNQSIDEHVVIRCDVYDPMQRHVNKIMSAAIAQSRSSISTARIRLEFFHHARKQSIARCSNRGRSRPASGCAPDRRGKTGRTR